MCEKDSLCAVCSAAGGPNSRLHAAAASATKPNPIFRNHNQNSASLCESRRIQTTAAATAPTSVHKTAGPRGGGGLPSPSLSAGAGSTFLYHSAPASITAQRSLQSQSYLAYIQGLKLGSQTMCDWSLELGPSSGNLLLDPGSSLDQPTPAQITLPPWLEKLYPNHQETPRVDSLCVLRDFMLQEALNVVKFA